MGSISNPKKVAAYLGLSQTAVERAGELPLPQAARYLGVQATVLERLNSVRPAPAPVTDQTPAPEPDPGEYPMHGTVSEVLAWVGDDDQRAVEAALAENNRSAPRTTLLEGLARLLGEVESE